MEDGGRDPPSEDEASESNESQTANEAAISGEPRGHVLVEANHGDIVQVGLEICTMMGKDSLSLRERVRVRGGAIVSDIFLHRTTNGDHLECSKMHGRLNGGGRGGSEDGGAKNGEWCDDRTRATIAEGMVDIYYCKWDFATRPICFHQAEKKRCGRSSLLSIPTPRTQFLSREVADGLQVADTGWKRRSPK